MQRFTDLRKRSCPPLTNDAERAFEYLIKSYIKSKVGISKHFLSEDLCIHLARNILELHTAKQMEVAGIGNKKAVTHDVKVRGDVIYWLDRSHEDPYENEFLDVMDAFIVYLNQSCYAGITGYEFHYTLYEKGSFYKRHIDQFQNNSSRQFSMICYLNEGWLKSHGGQLLIQMEDEEQSISPTIGKTVFF